MKLRGFLGAMAALLLVSLFNHPLIPSMEPRFAEAVREMMARGQYLIPIKNGVPYIEYPPLYFWLCILGKFIGLPDTAAIRLPSAIAFLFWIHGLFRMQKLLKPEWPPLLLPLAGAALPIALANFFIAQTDGLLALGVLIAMIGYCEHQLRPSDAAAKFPWKFWLGATLAVAAKGPVGLVLTIFPVAAESIAAVIVMKPAAPLKEIWRRGFALFPIRGLLLVLLINGPWYLAAGLQEGWDFFRAVVIYQNFTRFFVGFDHLQPWWYYLKTISYDLFPYSLLLPFGLWFAWKNRSDFVFRFSASWILTTVIFFSISHSKQGKYLLPAAPAFAMLGLTMISTWVSEKAEKFHRWLSAWAKTILACSGFVVVLYHFIPSGEIDRRNYMRINEILMHEPDARLFIYQWPRSQILYQLGAPLPWVRSSRDLYEQIHSEEIRPGDYLLVNEKYLTCDNKNDPAALCPTPDPNRFKEISEGSTTYIGSSRLILFRVRLKAAAASVPSTPEPPPVQWWEKFDTD
jgi:dolichol-phosphate mannosyltransferase